MRISDWSPDVSSSDLVTCFEVGYAVAKGKSVFGYIPDCGSFAGRIRERHPHAIGPGGVLDVHGWSIEEFGLPLNLMLSVPAPLGVGDARAALAQLVSYPEYGVREIGGASGRLSSEERGGGKGGDGWG